MFEFWSNYFGDIEYKPNSTFAKKNSFFYGTNQSNWKVKFWSFGLSENQSLTDYSGPQCLKLKF